ncbi:MAG: cell division protein FtsQ/DivIB [Clostridiaceae bacterium]
MKKNNELIKRRRKKLYLRRFIVFLIFAFAIIITLALKLDAFNVKQVNINGNEDISSEEIIKISKIQLGSNIFLINKKDLAKNIKMNPYVSEVYIKREIPDSLNVSITERTEAYYTQCDNGFLILDKDSNVLSENSKQPNYVNFTGINTENYEFGKALKIENSEKINIIKEFLLLSEGNDSGLEFSSIDVENINNLKLYINDMCIILGNKDNLDVKLSHGIQMIIEQELLDKKGYIDVSYEGVPVYYIEK